MTWQHRANSPLQVINLISKTVSDLVNNDNGLMPNLKSARTLGLFSDYGGQHDTSQYDCYSFLLIDMVDIEEFDTTRKMIRSYVFSDGRRFSYKKLNDIKRQHALVPYLGAVNLLNGIVVSILVDKKIAPIFIAREDMKNYEFRKALITSGLISWKPKVIEKLFRVLHFGSMIVSSMCHPHQNVLWFSDQDEIAPNVKGIIKVTKLAGGVLGSYIPHPMGHMRFGTTQSDYGENLIEDLTAVPDLAAGALCDIVPEIFDKHIILTNNNLFKSLEIPPKCQFVMDWYVCSSTRLKKLLVKVNNLPDKSCNVAVTYFYRLCEQLCLSRQHEASK